MNETCPTCGYRFVRERGFFLGAMYVSYALAGPLLALLTVLVQVVIFPDWPLHWVLFPAVFALIPFIPLIFRYSRVVYFHLEQWLDRV
jgi:hypothetical protein